MNTDPLWQGLLLVLATWTVGMGIVTVIAVNSEKSEDAQENVALVGCAIAALGAVLIGFCTLYIYWYLHVRIV